jgi:ribosome biogenesis GTPase
MLDNQIDLQSLGWDEFFRKAFESYRRAGCVAGRIAEEHRGIYKVLTTRGELSGTLAGKLRYESAQSVNLPAAGDWVAVQPRYEESASTIAGVLPRKSQFVRGAAGDRTEGQIVGANVDTIFLMTALNNDFNLRRVERYLVMAWESGAQPVVLLSKSDLCLDPNQKMMEVQALAIGAPVHATSVYEETGLNALRCYFRPGKTVGLVGSSGVGKSTLINYFAGRQIQRTQEIRSHDGRGRHTTTTRQLILLPGGGLVLDTPGMRELQLWEGQDAGLVRAFSDIESLAEQCYYRDCSHSNEPDCAVRAALADKELDPARLRSYEKLQKELRYQERKQDKAAEIREKNKWKKLCRLASEKAATKRTQE